MTTPRYDKNDIAEITVKTITLDPCSLNISNNIEEGNDYRVCGTKPLTELYSGSMTQSSTTWQTSHAAVDGSAVP